MSTYKWLRTTSTNHLLSEVVLQVEKEEEIRRYVVLRCAIFIEKLEIHGENRSKYDFKICYI